MAYTITQYTRKQASRLGVTVKRSTNPKKKLDVFKRDQRTGNTRKVASVGATGYGDYPTFIQTQGQTVANRHRKHYKQRHEKDRHVRGSAGYYADKLLW